VKRSLERLFFCTAVAIFLSACAQEKANVLQLHVWGLSEGEGQVGLYAAIGEFEKRYNATHEKKMRVATSTLGGRMNPQKLMTAIAGGSPPDVINQDRFSIGGWAARDAFLPLDEFIERDKAAPDAIRGEDYYSATWQEAVYRGKVYAIPNSTDDRILYYNKDLLRAAGYVNADGEVAPPKTWQELEEYALRLTKKGEHGTIERIGFIPNYGNSWLYLYGWQNGGKFMSADGLSCTLSHPRIVEALEWMTSLYDKLGGRAQVDAFTSTFQGGVQDPFLLGKVAMVIQTNGSIRTVARYKPDLNFAVTPAPVPEGQPFTTWSGGFSYAIPRGAKNVELAWELIRWLSSEEAAVFMNRVQQRYDKSHGRPFVPGIWANRKINEVIYQKFVLENPDLNDNLKRQFKVGLDMMPVSNFRPVTPVGQLLWDEQVRAIELATHHTYTPKEALDIGAKKVQEELDRLYGGKDYPLMNWGYALTIVGLGCLAGLGWIGFSVRQRGVKTIFKHESLAGYFFASPWIVGFLIFTLGPIIASIILSFCEYDILHPAKFVGFDHYKRLISDDPIFWKSLWNTTYMVIAIPLNMVVGLSIAMLLNTKVNGMSLYRTFFYLPAIVPLVAGSVLWIWVFNPQNGLLNSFLRMIGVEGPLWLQDVSWSKPSLILMGLWGAGAGMIIWLAGLQGIPRHLYEAAEIDGAGWWAKTWYVTIPMLTPYLFFNLIMGVISTFQIFTQAYVMTSGGPVDSTLFYVYYLFNNAFQYFKMGYASAMAWILFIIILILTLIQLKLAPRWVHYETEGR
jgi:multiple sugar transport system permease protein